MYFPIGEVYFQVRTVSFRDGIEKHSHFVRISLAMAIRDLILPHFLLEVLACFFRYFFFGKLTWMGIELGNFQGNVPKQFCMVIEHWYSFNDALEARYLSLKLMDTPLKVNMEPTAITHLDRKMIFQTSMIMFHLNLQG